MKLSCLPVSLYPDLASGRRSLQDWFHFAAELGLDGADLSVAHITSRSPHYLQGVRRAAVDEGVQIVMLATYSDFTQPDAVERARQVDDIRAWIDAAAEINASFLRLVAGQARPGLDEETTYAWVVDGLTACLPEASAAGVGLLYENHVRGAVWTANDWTQPAARFLEVARRTRGTDLQFLFDTANCLALGDDPQVVLDAVCDRLGAVHVSDIRQVGTFEPTTIGTGVTPIPALLRSISDAGFDGWISIEEGSRTGEDGFRTAVPFVRRTWDDVAVR